MKIHDDIMQTIGNTPLVKLNKMNNSTNEILMKLEFFNPLGSVKRSDRQKYDRSGGSYRKT